MFYSLEMIILIDKKCDNWPNICFHDTLLSSPQVYFIAN